MDKTYVGRGSCHLHCMVTRGRENLGPQSWQVPVVLFATVTTTAGQSVTPDFT